MDVYALVLPDGPAEAQTIHVGPLEQDCIHRAKLLEVLGDYRNLLIRELLGNAGQELGQDNQMRRTIEHLLRPLFQVLQPFLSFLLRT